MRLVSSSVLFSEVVGLEKLGRAAVGMALETGKTVVGITGHPAVFIIHVGFVVFMAVDTAENRIIAWICVTIGAKCPFPPVFP